MNGMIWLVPIVPIAAAISIAWWFCSGSTIYMQRHDKHFEER